MWVCQAVRKSMQRLYLKISNENNHNYNYKTQNSTKSPIIHLLKILMFSIYLLFPLCVYTWILFVENKSISSFIFLEKSKRKKMLIHLQILNTIEWFKNSVIYKIFGFKIIWLHMLNDNNTSSVYRTADIKVYLYKMKVYLLLHQNES